MTLFSLPEPHQYDPPRVPVRAHSRAITPRARRTDPRTSHEAAARVTPTAGATEARILDAYREHGPMTPFRCAELLHPSLEGTVRSAVGRLHKAGKLTATGATRPSSNGSPSMVLELAEEA